MNEVGTQIWSKTLTLTVWTHTDTSKWISCWGTTSEGLTAAAKPSLSVCVLTVTKGANLVLFFLHKRLKFTYSTCWNVRFAAFICKLKSGAKILFLRFYEVKPIRQLMTAILFCKETQTAHYFLWFMSLSSSRERYGDAMRLKSVSNQFLILHILLYKAPKWSCAETPPCWQERR